MTHDDIKLKYYHVLTDEFREKPGTNTLVNDRGEVEFYDGQLNLIGPGYDGFLESAWDVASDRFADEHEGEDMDEKTMVEKIREHIVDSVRIY